MNLTMRGFESKVITEDKISLDVPLDTSRPHVPLTAFHWGRVILDKGHRIRNAGKSALEAICLIKTEKRVVSMGTPFNNEYMTSHRCSASSKSSLGTTTSCSKTTSSAGKGEKQEESRLAAYPKRYSESLAGWALGETRER